MHSCRCIFESVYADGGVGVRAFGYSHAVMSEGIGVAGVSTVAMSPWD